MNKFKNIAALLASVFVIAIVGCDKEPPPEKTSFQNKESVVTAKAFQPALPVGLANLIVSDAKVTGLCYLDSINASPASDAPTTVKSGATLSLAGWAVYDAKLAQLGSAFAVMLLSKQNSFYLTADSYNRKGLGVALGNEKLDDAGLVSEGILVDVPAGLYRVLFLTQSGNNLLRCDTGRTLNIE